MQYDYAPGIPIDCALSRQIRAHIITKQLRESFERSTLPGLIMGDVAERAERSIGLPSLLRPQAE